jgi:hypothetical protein
VDDYYSGQEEIGDLIEEQRRLARSKTFFEKVVGTLCVTALLKERLAALTDAAVGQLMVDHVCNEMNVFSPELTICEVATERLIVSAIAIVPKAASVEKCGTPLVCPECGAKFWRADE